MKRNQRERERAERTGSVVGVCRHHRKRNRNFMSTTTPVRHSTIIIIHLPHGKRQKHNWKAEDGNELNIEMAKPSLSCYVRVRIRAKSKCLLFHLLLSLSLSVHLSVSLQIRFVFCFRLLPLHVSFSAEDLSSGFPLWNIYNVFYLEAKSTVETSVFLPLSNILQVVFVWPTLSLWSTFFFCADINNCSESVVMKATRNYVNNEDGR